MSKAFFITIFFNFERKWPFPTWKILTKCFVRFSLRSIMNRFSRRISKNILSCPFLNHLELKAVVSLEHKFSMGFFDFRFDICFEIFRIDSKKIASYTFTCRLSAKLAALRSSLPTFPTFVTPRFLIESGTQNQNDFFPWGETISH